MTRINLSSLIAPVYHDIFFSKARYQILAGGRSSAKGDTMYTKAIVNGLMDSTETYVFSGVKTGMWKRVGQQCINILNNRLGVPYTTNESKQMITYNNGRSKIFFESLDAGNSKSASERYKGYSPSTDNVMIIFDELAIIQDFDRVNAVINSFISRNNANVMFCHVFNPPKNKNAPIFDYVKNLQLKDDCEYLHTTIHDLPHHWFDNSVWAEIDWEKENNPSKYEHEWLGLCKGVEGMPFANFRETQVVSPFELENEIITQRWTVTDVGIADSMVFAYYVVCASGNAYKTSTFEYSGRETGKNIPYSILAKKFDEWYKKNKALYGNKATNGNYCDGLAFTTELQHIGYKVINLDGKKDRGKSFETLNHLIRNERFFILDKPENQLAISQLTNVEVELKTKAGEEITVITRPNNENTPIERQIHHVDTDGYFTLMVFKNVLKNKKKD